MKNKAVLSNPYNFLYVTREINSRHPLFKTLRKAKQFLIMLSLCILPSTSVFALPTDANQPIDVAANSASLDDKTGVTIITGAVKVIQGTMTIKADKLTMYRNAQGDINKMIAIGKPAFFTQQQQKGQPFSKAWGSKMLYLVSNQTVTITGNARVEQLHDKFTGEKVVYHMDKAIVNATGGKQRVKMVIQPKGNK